jgi:glycosyltransferase involved in cell wall biosynthesis
VVYGLEWAVSVCSQAELVQNIEDVAVLERLHVPARKLHVLGNGLDLVRFQPRPAEAPTVRQTLGVREDQVVAGVVGGLEWEKGFAELFEAARRLRRTRPEVVIVVGPTDPAKSGSLTQADLDRARAEAGVIFLGERREVESFYPGFDLFVLASHREGFPRAAMEAPACGLPIVASDIRGCRQVVDHGHTGLLVPARDAVALADAIATLAADPIRRQAMGRAARAHAEAEFDDRRVIDRTLDTYRQLLSGVSATRHRRGPPAGDQPGLTPR